MKKTPLIPRTLKKSLIGLSYKEFLKQRSSKIMTLCAVSVDKNFIKFDNRIQYLFDCCEDISEYKGYVLKLWRLAFKTISANSDYLQIENQITLYFSPLVSLTGEAGFENDKNSAIFTRLENFMKDQISELFNSDQDILLIAQKLKSWYLHYFKFLRYLELKPNAGELSFVMNLYNRYIDKFESLKSISPIIYLDCIKIIKEVYKQSEPSATIEFNDYYRIRCLDEIVVRKNNGIYDSFKQSLSDYYSVKLNRFANWAYKFFLGYGENPIGLIVLFFSINLFFAFIFTIGNFCFHMPETYNSICTIGKYTVLESSIVKNSFWPTFVNFIFFNNTTMFTVGYGDIYPVGIGAKILVMILQVLGYLISGTAIALILKRILRF